MFDWITGKKYKNNLQSFECVITLICTELLLMIDLDSAANNLQAVVLLKSTFHPNSQVFLCPCPALTRFIPKPLSFVSLKNGTN